MRYVILHHITFPEHYDLMFEIENHLITYSMKSGLINDFLQGDEVTIKRITDHRLMYLDYEGPINGNRGHVVQFDSGRYFESQHKQDNFVYRIDGTKLTGTFEIKNIDEEQYAIRYQASEKDK